MGNSISLYSNIQSGGGGNDEEKIITLGDTLDFIASYYILTTDFKTLSQLHEKQYCEDLVVLTSDIINKYFNDLEVKKLAHRIENGVDSSEKIVFFKKTNIENLNTPEYDKKEYCVEIAKFYIKIAHIFAAIVTTINPEYTYKDIYGNVVKRTLIQKSSIPEGVDVKISKINLCSERINALKGKLEESLLQDEYDESQPDESQPDESQPDESQPDAFQHDICSINLDKDGETNYLDDEPGINELIDLYFDGEYDFKTGKFMGMTQETEKQFQEDLKQFYLAFTDEEDIPVDIKKFSDIKLRDYSKKKFCDADKKGIKVGGTYKDELFLKYANNLKEMIKSVNKKQEELLSIVNKIFVYVTDPVTKTEVIRINPDLTISGINEIVIQTRQLIIELYINCETDFVEGVKIYEAIVESTIFETTKKHIEVLEKEKEKLISPYISKQQVSK